MHRSLWAAALAGVCVLSSYGNASAQTVYESPPANRVAPPSVVYPGHSRTAGYPNERGYPGYEAGETRVYGYTRQYRVPNSDGCGRNRYWDGTRCRR